MAETWNVFSNSKSRKIFQIDINHFLVKLCVVEGLFENLLRIESDWNVLIDTLLISSRIPAKRSSFEDSPHVGFNRRNRNSLMEIKHFENLRQSQTADSRRPSGNLLWNEKPIDAAQNLGISQVPMSALVSAEMEHPREVSVVPYARETNREVSECALEQNNFSQITDQAGSVSVVNGTQGRNKLRDLLPVVCCFHRL